MRALRTHLKFFYFTFLILFVTADLSYAAKEAIVKFGNHEKYDRLVFQFSQNVNYEVRQKKNDVLVILKSNEQVSKEKIENLLAAYIQLSHLKHIAEKNITAIKLKLAKGVKVKHFKLDKRIVIDFYQKNQPAEKISESTPNAPKQEDSYQTTQDTEHIQPITIRPIDVFANDKAYEIRFPWKKDQKAIAFKRAGYLWIGFEKYAVVDLNPLQKIPYISSKPAFQVEDQRLTLIKIPLPGNVHPTIRKEGTHWIFKLQEQDFRVTSELNHSIKKDRRNRNYLEIPILNPAKTIDIIDNEIGDRLLLTLTKTPAEGIEQAIEYVEFKVLPSYQGVVVKPILNDLWVAWKEGHLLIKSQSSLKIAKFKDLDNAKPQDRSSLFKIYSWRLGGKEQFVDNQFKFYRQIGFKSQEELDLLRLEMAKFYFSYEMPEKSLALLYMIAKNRSPLVKKPIYIGLYGGSLIFSRRYQEASRALIDGRLDHFPEINFWRGAAFAAQKKWDIAAKFFFPFQESLSKEYPKHLKVEFYLLALETAISTGRLRDAKKVLALFPSSLRSDQEKIKNYLYASLLWLEGKGQEARDIWHKLEEAQNIPLRAKAMLAWAESAYIDKAINIEKAIDKFEKLRFVYRDSDVEYTALNRLSDLYLKMNKPIKSLKTLKTILRYYPNHPKNGDIEKKMNKTFLDFLLTDHQDTGSALKTIAMYNEFRELTPTGKEGDQIMHKLVDHFENMDLLDNSIAVLKNLIDTRLKGEEKLKAELRLAVLQIDNHQSPEALKSLKNMDLKSAPNKIKDQRRWLLAKTLFDQNKNQEALDLLTTDPSEQSKLLQSEIYWSEKKWHKVAKIFENLIKEANIGDELTDDQAKYILNLATAYALGEQTTELKLLQHDYGKKMKASSYDQLFAVVSGKNKGYAHLLKQEAQQIALSELYGAFMENYKKNILGQ